MSQERNFEGPYRRVETALEAAGPIPTAFVVRRDRDELVIESRRRLAARPGLALAAGGLVAIGSLMQVAHPLIPAILLGLCGLVALAKYWGRTTVVLRGGKTVVVQERLFFSRELRGSTESLHTAGIVEVDPDPWWHRSPGPEVHLFGLDLEVAGKRAIVFRGASRAELGWVVEEIAAWKRDRGGV